MHDIYLLLPTSCEHMWICTMETCYHMVPPRLWQEGEILGSIWRETSVLWQESGDRQTIEGDLQAPSAMHMLYALGLWLLVSVLSTSMLHDTSTCRTVDLHKVKSVCFCCVCINMILTLTFLTLNLANSNFPSFEH